MNKIIGQEFSGILGAYFHYFKWVNRRLTGAIIERIDKEEKQLYPLL